MKKYLGLLLILCCAVQNNGRTIPFEEFRDTSRVLVNPHKGWYHHYYDGTTDAYPSGTDAILGIAGMNHIYVRLPWSHFEPQEGIYDWSSIDQVISTFGPKGLKIALRITTYDPWVLQFATPQWVKDAGAQGSFITVAWAPTTYWEPAFDDSIFLTKLSNFHSALASRYDFDSLTTYVDIGSYGSWGEGHKTFGSGTKGTYDILKKHVDMQLSIYKNVQLVAVDDFITYNLGALDRARMVHYLKQNGIAIRDDSPMVSYYVETYPQTFSVSSPWLMDSMYREKPVILEAQHYGTVKSDGNWAG